MGVSDGQDLGANLALQAGLSGERGLTGRTLRSIGAPHHII